MIEARNAYTAKSRHVLHLSLNRLEERLDAARFTERHGEFILARI